MYYGYDGLNRKSWMATNSNGSSPLATWSYDSTASGNVGIGRLTSETFASGPSQSVSGNYAYTYDARGRQTTWNATIAGQAQTFQYGFNDAGQQTRLTYPSGDVVATNYGAQDWLSSSTLTSGSTQTALLSSIRYQNAAGAAGNITNATFGNGVYTLNQGFDGDLRLNSQQATMTSSGTVEFGQTRSFDAMGNVVAKTTTLPGGTVNEAYCYDEQDRMVWAGSTGTPGCGVGLTQGTLAAATPYTQQYGFDTLNRMLYGMQAGAATYGDANHLDAITSEGGYTASYDAAGNMTCRAPYANQTCAGNTPTGQAMTSDALDRLLRWQNTATSPTQTMQDAYDGEGQRVWTQTTTNGNTVTTAFFGTIEVLSTSGSITTGIEYLQVGPVLVENAGGTLTYLVQDGLSSVTVALTTTGSVQATALYAPYGVLILQQNAMPTHRAFTGQMADPSGLAYYNARYYDPQVGQFTSADRVQGPNRYAYVGGNPETRNDPTGNWVLRNPLWYLRHDMLTDTNVGLNVVGGGLVAFSQYVQHTQLQKAVHIFKKVAPGRLARELDTKTDPVDAVDFLLKNESAPAVLAKMVGRGRVGRQITSAMDEVEGMSVTTKVVKGLGIGLMIIGGALDGYVNYQNYLQSHPNDQGGAIRDGALHATLSTLGAAGGAFLGAGLGTLICPGVCTFIGGALGGWLGGAAGDYVADFFESGAESPTTGSVDSSADVPDTSGLAIGSI